MQWCSRQPPLPLLPPFLLLLLAAVTHAHAGWNKDAACAEPPECDDFISKLAKLQLTCESPYSRVDKTAPAGVTVGNVCPVSCGVCDPTQVHKFSKEERCRRSPHCSLQFKVCMDGYGGFPACQHMPVIAAPYKGKVDKNGLPVGYGEIICALNKKGYHDEKEINMTELAGEMQKDHRCEYKGEFRAGKRHGDGTFAHSIGLGGSKFAYEYDGEWKADVRQGSGKLTATFTVSAATQQQEGGADETQLFYSYEGDWKNGAPSGQGSLRNTDGTRYEGSVREGGPHGHGLLCTSPRSRTSSARQTCIQIQFANSTAIGEGTVVSGLRRYPVSCGGEHNASESDCHMVSHLSAEGAAAQTPRSELRFTDLQELEEKILPRALAADIVRPVGDEVDVKELRRVRRL
jgi:hypothetical protein